MIAIVNIGPFDDPDILGERDYEVRINSKVITRFKHQRIDGLAVCLMKASEAVSNQQWRDLAKELVPATKKL